MDVKKQKSKQGTYVIKNILSDPADHILFGWYVAELIIFFDRERGKLSNVTRLVRSGKDILKIKGYSNAIRTAKALKLANPSYEFKVIKWTK